MGRQDGDRYLTQMQTNRKILLLDLDSAITQKAFGLDARIASSRQYGITQMWSTALHDWYPDLDGIRYRARHENDTLNICLFLDRCGQDIDLLSSTKLGALPRQQVLSLVVPYGIVVDLS